MIQPRVCTGVSAGFLTIISRKYGDVVFKSIRQLTRVIIKLEKSKCDMELLRFSSIYDRALKFLNIKLWRKQLKLNNIIQHTNDMYEKLDNLQMNNIESIIEKTGYKKVRKYVHRRILLE